MKRICVLVLAIALGVTACAGVFDKCVKPEITAATKLAPADLAKEVAAFLTCGIADLPTLAAPCAVAGLADLALALGPGGADAVNCIISYYENNGTGLLQSRAKAVGAKRGVTPELYGTHACNGFVSGAVVASAFPGKTSVMRERRGDAPGTTLDSSRGGPSAGRPSAERSAAVVAVDSIGTLDAYPLTAVPFLAGEAPLSASLDLLIVAERSSSFAAESMDCGPGMHSVTPMAPGVVCLRDGITFTDALCKMKRAEAKPYPYTSTFSGSGDPWAEATIDLMRRLPMSACAEPTLGECDAVCGGANTSLAPRSGCLCHVGKGMASRWVPARELPGARMVAAR